MDPYHIKIKLLNAPVHRPLRLLTSKHKSTRDGSPGLVVKGGDS